MRMPIGVVLAVVITLAACSGSAKPHAATSTPSQSSGPGQSSGDAVPDELVVSSPAFAAGATIPLVYTCAGDNVSPPLQWSGVPDGTSELAVVVDDPDAPGTFVHWIVAGLPATTTGLDEGKLPAGAVEARNGAGDAEYTGPCPPAGAPHHYRFTVYALGKPSGVAAGAATKPALAAITTAATARGRVVAMWGR
jgi:Raf kinase inhibitor-like YbhB/YbcL family protein